MSKRPRHDSDATDVPSSSPLQTRNSHIGKGTSHEGWHSKFTQLDETATQQEVISCTLPPHQVIGFASYSDYEVHYQKTHVNRCIECGKNLPTDHFLSLHIKENHDPITEAKRERGDKTYECFVEGCDKVCSTWQKRRMHLVDKHMFPRNYDFFIVNDGLDNRNSMLRSERQHRKPNLASSVHASVSSKTEHVQDEAPSTISADQSDETKHRPRQKDVNMEDVADSLAALTFIPRSVTFGRRPGGGLAKS